MAAAALAVVAAARALLAETIPNTSTVTYPAHAALAHAVRRLDAMERANTEALLARVREHRATPMHLVGRPGDRYALCGADAQHIPYGWAKPEYLDRWYQAGQTLCRGCVDALGST